MSTNSIQTDQRNIVGLSNQSGAVVHALNSMSFTKLIAELWQVHPFREGNGRTQRIYIEQLCLNNGRFEIDFTDVSKEEMIAASIRSANASNDMLEELISSCLVEK